MKRKKMVFFVTGSIAAYKAADIVRAFTKEGHDVHVVLSEAATRFITPLTFQALTMNNVVTDIFDEPVATEIRHISLVRDADVCVVVPATANTMNKLASGVADSVVSTILIARPKNVPLFIAPAMNTNMYENEATQRNIMLLKEQGVQFIEPISGLLACGDVGNGALASSEVIIETIRAYMKE